MELRVSILNRPRQVTCRVGISASTNERGGGRGASHGQRSCAGGGLLVLVSAGPCVARSDRTVVSRTSGHLGVEHKG